ncbi:MAG: hypothetical protein JXO22_01130 [Phycisphaerae bacterium]|nr:hypothetical protein [Phycisphaerae bacterium]
MSTRTITLNLALAILGITLTGCYLFGTSPETIDDPPGTHPELAGQWELTGSLTGTMGILTVDETGDPISVSGSPDVASVLGAGAITADGTRRTAANGLEYIGTGQALLSGDQLTITIDVTVYSGILQLGTFSLNYSGTLTDADHATGNAVITQTLPGMPYQYEETIDAERISS